MADQLTHEKEYRGDQLIGKLAKFKLFVGGAGAVGSNLISNLCRQGFQDVTVIDFDRVEPHNVGSQAYGRKDGGSKKVAALSTMVFRDTGVTVKGIDKKLEIHNAHKLLKGADCYVDAFDNHDARKIMADVAKAQHIPCLHIGLDPDFGEVCWDVLYKVPPDRAVDGKAPCDYPLARNTVLLAVAVASEVLIDFVDTREKKSYEMTLRDRQVRKRQ